MKKIKVFLGAYINSINAQNLNCLALAKHLDKEKFEVAAMHLYSGSLDISNLSNVKLFKVFYPHKISKYIGYLMGIIWGDIVYLPKGEICNWNKFWIRLLGKKSFKTVEGIYGDEMLGQILSSGITYEEFKQSFKGYDKVFSITTFLKNYNFEHHDIQTEEKILYLGTDTSIFLNPSKSINKLQNIIFIGRLKRRKGVYDVLEMAKKFHKLHFFLAGDGEEKDEIIRYIQTHGLNNVKLLGNLPHGELAQYLSKMDLHLFPSRSEGFPKVTLETAAAGVPSVVYPDYGASEWIDSGKNGFIVNDLEGMQSLMEHLLTNPEKLQAVSQEAIKLAQMFDWKVVIHDWERVITDLYCDKG